MYSENMFSTKREAGMYVTNDWASSPNLSQTLHYCHTRIAKLCLSRAARTQALFDSAAVARGNLQLFAPES
jgi:hypothetical protein